MATALQVIRIPILGVTCDRCTGTVRRALEGIPGVSSGDRA
jgi:copper chaperone CopZ